MSVKTVTRTIDPVELVRPELRRLGAYHLDLTPCRHKLDQNEVPWDLPRRLKEEMTAALLAADWARYPDFHADALRQDLGLLHGWPWEGVLVGNGSNELLGVTLTALVGPGREVLGAEPSFGLYRSFVLKSGGIPHFLPPRPDLALPADELEDEVERDPRRPLLLCTPNNPTGAALPPERIEALLEKLEAPLLLDNAYGEFCQYDYRPLLARHRHLVLFRTFSKAWSLAGMRLGYLLADPGLVTELIKVKLPYNVSHAAALAGRTVLFAREEARRRVAILTARRDHWARMLAEEGLEVFPSEANFLLVRVPGEWGRSSLEPVAKGPFPLGGGGLEKGEGQDGGGLNEGNLDHQGSLDGGRPHLDPPPVPTLPLPEGGHPLPGASLAAGRIREGLEARSIRVREVGSYPGLAGCLRISVGTGASLRATRKALREIREEAR